MQFILVIPKLNFSSHYSGLQCHMIIPLLLPMMKKVMLFFFLTRFSDEYKVEQNFYLK